MGARSKARKRALDLLYAADMRGESAVDALDAAIGDGEPPNNAYTATLVRGVAEHAARIDELLTEYSTDWTIDRMPAVDRNVLRLGVWELLWGPEDVPGTVAVSEAMGLVRELSTDDSPPFVNGILGAIQRNRESLV
ncbi:transcription antitermination factor NusB [Nocardioides salsibiostraticola]